jgi:hypothetical protein
MEEEYDFEKAKQIAAEREMKKEKKKKKRTCPNRPNRA